MIVAGRHTTKQAKTINVMNNKLLVLLPASLISVAAFGGVSKDTVVVKSTSSVDTVVSKSSSIVKHNIASVKENVDTVVVTVGKRGLYVSEDLNGDVSVWTSKHKKKEKPILKLIDPPFLLVEEIHLSMKKTIDKKRYSERSFC